MFVLPDVDGVPRIKVSGNLGASANSRPPNPQPISAISTFLDMGVIVRCSSSLASCDSVSVLVISASGLFTAYAGYNVAQSMCAGLLGLKDVRNAFINPENYSTM